MNTAAPRPVGVRSLRASRRERSSECTGGRDRRRRHGRRPCEHVAPQGVRRGADRGDGRRREPGAGRRRCFGGRRAGRRVRTDRRPRGRRDHHRRARLDARRVDAGRDRGRQAGAVREAAGADRAGERGGGGRRAGRGRRQDPPGVGRFHAPLRSGVRAAEGCPAGRSGRPGSGAARVQPRRVRRTGRDQRVEHHRLGDPRVRLRALAAGLADHRGQLARRTAVQPGRSGAARPAGAVAAHRRRGAEHRRGVPQRSLRP
jgi:hypothetical protein